MDNTKRLVRELRRMKVQTGSLMCLGCGNEHNCGIHGCALIRKAADTIEGLDTFDKTSTYQMLQKNAKLEEELADLKDKLDWRAAAHELPTNDDYVLVYVSGCYGNTAFFGSVLIGCYVDEEGWIIEGHEEWENPQVSHWLPLPDDPVLLDEPVKED